MKISKVPQSTIPVPEAMTGLSYKKTQWYMVYEIFCNEKMSHGRIDFNLKIYKTLHTKIGRLIRDQEDYAKLGDRAKMTQHLFYHTDKDENGDLMTPRKLMLGYIDRLTNLYGINKMHYDILAYVHQRMMVELEDFEKRGRILADEHEAEDKERRRLRAKDKVWCVCCGREVNRSSLARHRKYEVCIEAKEVRTGKAIIIQKIFREYLVRMKK